MPNPDAVDEAGRRRGTVLSTLVELAGLACFVVAGWWITPALGMAVAGGGLLLVGHALDGTIVPSPAAVVARVPWTRLRAWWPRRPAAAAGEAS
jgi:hypothetical protein